jgi:hypothetical protein
VETSAGGGGAGLLISEHKISNKWNSRQVTSLLIIWLYFPNQMFVMSQQALFSCSAATYHLKLSLMMELFPSKEMFLMYCKCVDAGRPRK